MQFNSNNEEKGTENFNKIKQDSILLELLYRSLYILKSKFSKYKKDITSIYLKYYPNPTNTKNFPIINIFSFFPLLQEIFDQIKITIPRLNDINTIFNYDISKFDKNSKEHLELIKLIEKNLVENNKKNIEKYNKKFYTKKIEPIVNYFIQKGNNDDLTEIKSIVEYDRKGRIINNFGKLLEQIGIKSSFKLITKNPKEEYDLNMEKKDILYIEILPIILADFLQENKDFVVINLDNDDNLNQEIKNRFDNDLIKRIHNEKNLNNLFKTYPNKSTQNNFKQNSLLLLPPDEQKKICENKKYKLQLNLKFYKNLLSHKKSKGESYTYILDFITKIETEIIKLDQQIKSLILKINALILEEQKNERKKERKKIATSTEKLHEIFNFYCSQHKAPASHPTFDEIEFKGKHMNISEFCKFCKEFKVPLEMDKLMEIYNKRDPLMDKSEINFNDFIVILEKISVIMNEKKINKLEKKIDKVNKKIKGLSIIFNSDDGEDFEILNSTSDIKILTTKNDELKKNLELLKSLNNSQIFKEFKKFLEIDNPKKFRDKMKGFLFKYWDYTEKIESYESLTKDEYIRVKKQVNKFKKMREKSAKEKEENKLKLKQELYDKKKEEFIINNKKLVQKIKDKEEKKTYISLKNLNPNQRKQNNNENLLINFKSNTYEGIENTKLLLNQQEKEELYIDDNDDNSDDEILQKFNIKENKEEKSKDDNNKNEIKIKNNNLNDDKSNALNDLLVNISNSNQENNNSRNMSNNFNNNDNLSGINTENTNATFEINALKMNLKPKKKDNIYFSLNNEIGISDITEKMKEKEFNNEENIMMNENSNSNENKNNNEKEEKEKKGEKNYQELYPNTPRFDSIGNKKSMNSNKNKKIKPIGIHKKINISEDVSSLIRINNNRNKNKNIIINLDEFKKEKTNNLEDLNNHDNNTNSKIIQLPSLSMNNLNNYENNIKEVNNTQPNNNIIILPEIKSQKYNSKNNINNNEKSKSPGNNRYLLFQNNFKNSLKKHFFNKDNNNN